jgi:hypothetical protein
MIGRGGGTRLVQRLQFGLLLIFPGRTHGEAAISTRIDPES